MLVHLHDGLAPDGSLLPFHGTQDDYLDLAIRPGAWVGAAELAALAHGYQVPIYAFCDDGTCISFQYRLEAEPIYLAFADRHCELLSGAPLPASTT